MMLMYNFLNSISNNKSIYISNEIKLNNNENEEEDEENDNIEDKLIHYRRHGGNVSEMKHYPLLKMIKNRIIFIKRIVSR